MDGPEPVPEAGDGRGRGVSQAPLLLQQAPGGLPCLVDGLDKAVRGDALEDIESLEGSVSLSMLASKLPA